MGGVCNTRNRVNLLHTTYKFITCVYLITSTICRCVSLVNSACMLVILLSWVALYNIHPVELGRARLYPSRVENFVGFKHKKSSVFVGFSSRKSIKAKSHDVFFVVLIGYRRYLNVRIVGFCRSKNVTK